VHAVAAAAVILAVHSAAAAPGDRVTIRVLGRPPAAMQPVYLVDGAGRARRVGTLARGRRLVRVRLPKLPAAVYTPATLSGSRLVRGRGTLSLRPLPPRGFGPAGTAGCAPASPRFAFDAFGTATGTQFWGLFEFNPHGATLAGATVTYDGVVGKDVKIVFRMTSGIPSVFYAIAPDGAHVAPDWVPEPHLGSNWRRPGAEWGAGFTFATPGCWNIHAEAPHVHGDIFVDVRS
jgi:hypothetical protein